MVSVLSENQQRIAAQSQCVQREEPWFYSELKEVKYYKSEIDGLDEQTLKDLLVEVESYQIKLSAKIEEVEKRIELGVDDRITCSMRVKRNYTQKIYRKIKSSLAKHEQRKNLKSVKYTSMLNKYQNEKQRIMYNLLIDEIGASKFMEFSSKSAQMANQTHPNPKLKANKHLWLGQDQ